MLDNPNWHEIPVIASFDSKGKIKPLYLRINGERYKVLTCIDRGFEFTHLAYDITIENYGKAVPLTLGFWMDGCIWRYSTAP